MGLNCPFIFAIKGSITLGLVPQQTYYRFKEHSYTPNFINHPMLFVWRKQRHRCREWRTTMCRLFFSKLQTPHCVRTTRACVSWLTCTRGRWCRNRSVVSRVGGPVTNHVTSVPLCVSLLLPAFLFSQQLQREGETLKIIILNINWGFLLVNVSTLFSIEIFVQVKMGVLKLTKPLKNWNEMWRIVFLF